MRINDGDSLELVVSENGEIIIAKYDSFKGNEETIDGILQIIGKEMNLHLAVCNSEIFIGEYSTLSKALIGKEISSIVLAAIEERKISSMSYASLLESGGSENFIVFPLVKNSESLGAFLVIDTISISDEQTRMLNCFRNIIISILKI